MQSTNLHHIKAALWEQAFLGWTRVSCPMGCVIAIRKSKGHLQAKVLGWGRWYPVESVLIEKLFALGKAPRRILAPADGSPPSPDQHPQ